jgi:hypothetical protein
VIGERRGVRVVGRVTKVLESCLAGEEGEAAEVEEGE